MAYANIGDRFTATRDGETEEKVTVVGFIDPAGTTLRVRFPDGEVLKRNESQLLVDQDHQTCFDLDNHRGDHLISITHTPNAAINDIVKEFPDIKEVMKIRLDVLTNLVEIALQYPNTGSVIDTLIKNMPKNQKSDVDQLKDMRQRLTSVELNHEAKMPHGALGKYMKDVPETPEKTFIQDGHVLTDLERRVHVLSYLTIQARKGEYEFSSAALEVVLQASSTDIDAAIARLLELGILWDDESKPTLN